MFTFFFMAVLGITHLQNNKRHKQPCYIALLFLPPPNLILGAKQEEILQQAGISDPAPTTQLAREGRHSCALPEQHW